MLLSFIKNGLKKIKPLYKAYRFLIHVKNSNQDINVIEDISIKRNDILNIANDNRKADTFIETGTFMGDTIELLKNKFAMLYSIELSIDLANKAIQRFSLDDNVEIIQGNSSEQLGHILAKIKTPCLFWLDGHYSSEFWIGTEYIKTAKGNKNTPILEELAQVSKHFVKDHVILIDDARLFTGKNDYPTISVLKKFIKKNLPLHNLEVKNDIIRILPKNN